MDGVRGVKGSGNNQPGAKTENTSSWYGKLVALISPKANPQGSHAAFQKRTTQLSHLSLGFFASTPMRSMGKALASLGKFPTKFSANQSSGSTPRLGAATRAFNMALRRLPK